MVAVRLAFGHNTFNPDLVNVACDFTKNSRLANVFCTSSATAGRDAAEPVRRRAEHGTPAARAVRARGESGSYACSEGLPRANYVVDHVY